MFEGGQEIVAEAASLLVGMAEDILLEDRLEEILSQIFGVFWRPAVAADEGIERIPIVLAQ